MIRKFSIFLFSGVLFLTFSLFGPQKAHAQFVVTDIGNTIQSTLNQISNAGSLVLQNKELIKDTVLIPAVKTLANNVLNKITNDVINWANGGFNDEPGFINNWGEFLRGTEYDVYYDSFNKALDAASVESGRVLDINDLAGQAQANYQNRQNGGNLNQQRDIAKTIALFAANQLSDTQVEDVIAGKGETLSKILGSEEAKEAFSRDITVGGWDGYIALTNPSNHSLGVQSLVTSSLNQRAQTELTNTIDDVQTPVKYLNKTECRNGAVDEDGNCEEGEVTVTPGGIVAAKLEGALQSEEDQLKLADELVSILIKSIGQLTDGLIQSGVSKLTGAVNDASFFSKDKQDYFAEFATLNELQEEQQLQSINRLYVGGPEDINRGQSVQHVIDFKNDFEPTLNMMNQELEYIKEQRQVIRDTETYIYGLDRCVPGPDYNWEDRYLDNALSIQATENTNYPDGNKSERTLPETRTLQNGLLDTRIMVNDPLVNMPGAAVMNQLMKQFLDGYENQFVAQQKNEEAQINASTAIFIAEELQAGFNTYSEKTYKRRFPLFESDWDALSTTEKNALISIVDTVNSEYVLDNGIGIGVDVDARNKENVLSFAWDQWAKNTDPEKKEDLRLAYLEIQKNAPTQGTLNEQEVMLDQIKRDAQLIRDYHNDCFTLRNYVLDESTALSDLEVKSYLASEYAKQNDGNPLTISPYRTAVITSPGSIANSILGFNSQSEKDQYMQGNYPPITLQVSNGEEETPVISNITDLFWLDSDRKVSELLKDSNIKDWQKNEIANIGTSGLFCRSKAVFFAKNVDGNAKNNPQTYCYYPWYRTQSIEYRSALSGITQ